MTLDKAMHTCNIFKFIYFILFFFNFNSFFLKIYCNSPILAWIRSGFPRIFVKLKCQCCFVVVCGNTPEKRLHFVYFLIFWNFIFFLHIYFVANNLVRTVVGNLQLGITESPVRQGHWSSVTTKQIRNSKTLRR